MFNLFKPPIQNPGVQHTIDPRNARKDLIVGAADPNVPHKVSWLNDFLMLQRHNQNGDPFCVTYGATHLRERKLLKQNAYVPLNPDYMAMADGTGPNGNTFETVLAYAKNTGWVKQSDFQASVPISPLPQNPPALPADKFGQKLSGYAFLNDNDDVEVMSAVAQDPIQISFGIEHDTFYYRTQGSVVQAPIKPYQAYHSVALVGYESGNTWTVFDSLLVDWYCLAWNYPFTGAVTEMALPDNWQQTQQQNQNAQTPNNANYYGKPRNYATEQVVAGLLVTAFKSFNNPSVYQAAGRFWNLYVRAVVYGNYSVTDVVNDCYHWRRTGSHIFYFDLIRK